MLKRVIFKASRTSLKIIIFYILFSRENVFVFLLFSVFIFIFADAVSISLKKNYAINHNEGLVITISNKPSLTPSLCIEASVPSQESERPYRCVLGISILSLSTVFWLDFGAVPTVWCFFFPPFIMIKLIGTCTYTVKPNHISLQDHVRDYHLELVISINITL